VQPPPPQVPYACSRSPASPRCAEG
jgi:hypothetical protein